MLWFVGTGINGYRGLSLAALDVLKKCDIVYVERFTSALSDGDLQGLNSLLDKEVKPVRRWFVEDGREILETAESKQVALVTYGDPLVATTHNELRSRAARKSVMTAVIHSASGIASIMGETGLHAYKFGRMVTMMSEPQSAVSVYNTILENLLAGNHTLILTEYRDDDTKEPFFLSPVSVLEMLMNVEHDQKHQIFSINTFVVVASRIGSTDQRITSGKVGSLVKIDFGIGPHSLIVTGSLHFTESEALVALTESIDGSSDNSRNVKRISIQMVEKYAPKARQALQQMRDIVTQDANRKVMFEVLENAEFYIADSERFLRQAKFELAVLSIGYAEGLIDALRFQKGIDPWQTHS
jgi:diphthine synthase